MQQISLESSMHIPNSIDQVVESNTQLIIVDIHHHNLMEGITIINKKIVTKNEQNLTFDQLIQHIRKLKYGQIKNKSNTIQEDECAIAKEERKVVDNEV